MPREFQIRVEDHDNRQIDCVCFDNMAEANAAYTEMIQEETEGQEYHFELVEVLRQDTVRTDLPKEVA